MSLIVFMALKEAWCPVQQRHLETARQGVHWTLLSCCASDPTLGGKSNEIDYSVSHSSGGSYIRGRHPVSRAGRQANRPGQGGGVQWQEDRAKGQGRGRLPPVFHGGERVRGHHGRPEEYRRAPFRLRLLRRGSR